MIRKRDAQGTDRIGGAMRSKEAAREDDSGPGRLLDEAQDKRLAAELTKAIFECFHGELGKKNAAEMGEMVSQVYFRCLKAVRDER